MSDYTDQDQSTIRRAAFGAIALVSKADPGFFDMFAESMAGSKAFAAAPAPVQELLRGGFIAPPTGDAQQVESAVLGDLSQSMTILAGDPQTQQGFRDVVLSACEKVAEAKGGVSAEEQAVIERVRAAVSGSAQSAPQDVSQDGSDLV